MKSFAKSLALVAGLTGTGAAVAQTDGDVLGQLGGVLGGLGIFGVVIVGWLLWWFFRRGD